MANITEKIERQITALEGKIDALSGNYLTNTWKRQREQQERDRKKEMYHSQIHPSIVFDEVDTGVSGEIADKMAGIMREMAECMQVISITHLPQVASLGQTHYRVYKSDTETSTATHLIKLSEKERIEEIARMLSGSSLTAAALDNARELLKRNDLKDGKK